MNKPGGFVKLCKGHIKQWNPPSRSWQLDSPLAPRNVLLVKKPGVKQVSRVLLHIIDQLLGAGVNVLLEIVVLHELFHCLEDIMSAIQVDDEEHTAQPLTLSFLQSALAIATQVENEKQLSNQSQNDVISSTYQSNFPNISYNNHFTSVAAQNQISTLNNYDFEAKFEDTYSKRSLTLPSRVKAVVKNLERSYNDNIGIPLSTNSTRDMVGIDKDISFCEMSCSNKKKLDITSKSKSLLRYRSRVIPMYCYDSSIQTQNNHQKQSKSEYFNRISSNKNHKINLYLTRKNDLTNSEVYKTANIHDNKIMNINFASSDKENTVRNKNYDMSFDLTKDFENSFFLTELNSETETYYSADSQLNSICNSSLEFEGKKLENYKSKKLRFENETSDSFLNTSLSKENRSYRPNVYSCNNQKYIENKFKKQYLTEYSLKEFTSDSLSTTSEDEKATDFINCVEKSNSKDNKQVPKRIFYRYEKDLDNKKHKNNQLNRDWLKKPPLINHNLPRKSKINSYSLFTLCDDNISNRGYSLDIKKNSNKIFDVIRSETISSIRNTFQRNIRNNSYSCKKELFKTPIRSTKSAQFNDSYFKYDDDCKKKYSVENTLSYNKKNSCKTLSFNRKKELKKSNSYGDFSLCRKDSKSIHEKTSMDDKFIDFPDYFNLLYEYKFRDFRESYYTVNRTLARQLCELTRVRWETEQAKLLDIQLISPNADVIEPTINMENDVSQFLQFAQKLDNLSLYKSNTGLEIFAVLEFLIYSSGWNSSTVELIAKYICFLYDQHVELWYSESLLEIAVNELFALSSKSGNVHSNSIASPSSITNLLSRCSTRNKNSRSTYNLSSCNQSIKKNSPNSKYTRSSYKPGNLNKNLCYPTTLAGSRELSPDKIVEQNETLDHWMINNTQETDGYMSYNNTTCYKSKNKGYFIPGNNCSILKSMDDENEPESHRRHSYSRAAENDHGLWKQSMEAMKGSLEKVERPRRSILRVQELIRLKPNGLNKSFPLMSRLLENAPFADICILDEVQKPCWTTQQEEHYRYDGQIHYNGNKDLGSIDISPVSDCGRNKDRNYFNSKSRSNNSSPHEYSTTRNISEETGRNSSYLDLKHDKRYFNRQSYDLSRSCKKQYNSKEQKSDISFCRNPTQSNFRSKKKLKFDNKKQIYTSSRFYTDHRHISNSNIIKTVENFKLKSVPYSSYSNSSSCDESIQKPYRKYKAIKKNHDTKEFLNLIQRGEKYVQKNSSQGTLIGFQPGTYLDDVVDLAICLGGDGTLIYASHLFSSEKVPPILTFSAGSLGFLTIFTPKQIFGVLNKLLVPRISGSRSLLTSQPLVRERQDSLYEDFIIRTIVRQCTPLADYFKQLINFPASIRKLCLREANKRSVLSTPHFEKLLSSDNIHIPSVAELRKSEFSLAVPPPWMRHIQAAVQWWGRAGSYGWISAYNKKKHQSFLDSHQNRSIKKNSLQLIAGAAISQQTKSKLSTKEFNYKAFQRDSISGSPRLNYGLMDPVKDESPVFEKNTYMNFPRLQGKYHRYHKSKKGNISLQLQLKNKLRKSLTLHTSNLYRKSIKPLFHQSCKSISTFPSMSPLLSTTVDETNVGIPDGRRRVIQSLLFLESVLSLCASYIKKDIISYPGSKENFLKLIKYIPMSFNTVSLLNKANPAIEVAVSVKDTLFEISNILEDVTSHSLHVNLKACMQCRKERHSSSEPVCAYSFNREALRDLLELVNEHSAMKVLLSCRNMKAGALVAIARSTFPDVTCGELIDIAMELLQDISCTKRFGWLLNCTRNMLKSVLQVPVHIFLARVVWRSSLVELPVLKFLINFGYYRPLHINKSAYALSKGSRLSILSSRSKNYSNSKSETHNKKINSFNKEKENSLLHQLSSSQNLYGLGYNTQTVELNESLTKLNINEFNKSNSKIRSPMNELNTISPSMKKEFCLHDSQLPEDIISEIDQSVIQPVSESQTSQDLCDNIELPNTSGFYAGFKNRIHEKSIINKNEGQFLSSSYSSNTVHKNNNENEKLSEDTYTKRGKKSVNRSSNKIHFSSTLCHNDDFSPKNGSENGDTGHVEEEWFFQSSHNHKKQSEHNTDMDTVVASVYAINHTDFSDILKSKKFLREKSKHNFTKSEPVSSLELTWQHRLAVVVKAIGQRAVERAPGQQNTIRAGWDEDTDSSYTLLHSDASDSIGSDVSLKESWDAILWDSYNQRMDRNTQTPYFEDIKLPTTDIGTANFVQQKNKTNMANRFLFADGERNNFERSSKATSNSTLNAARFIENTNTESQSDITKSESCNIYVESTEKSDRNYNKYNKQLGFRTSHEKSRSSLINNSTHSTKKSVTNLSRKNKTQEGDKKELRNKQGYTSSVLYHQPIFQRWQPVVEKLRLGPLPFLNETLIQRAGSSMCQLEVFIDGQFITKLVSDGVIISTPTGSTAYSLSAGGSMVHPSVRGMLLTPMYSHTLSTRAVIVQDDAVLEFRVCNKSAPAELIIDGRDQILLLPKSVVQIRGQAPPIGVVVQNHHPANWFTRVSNALHWNVSHARGLGEYDLFNKT